MPNVTHRNAANCRKMHRMSSGYTLLELSIVLVIVGLLVGGVLAGKNLIRSAEINQINVERVQWSNAVRAFRDQYRELPGDMPNATDIWGATNSNNSACLDIPSTSKTTCNGDGNGYLDIDINGRETFLFWKHLSNAGLISGQFTGVHGSGSTVEAIIGENVPGSQFAHAGWSFDESGAGSSAYWNRPNEPNTLVLGAESRPYSTEGRTLSTAESFALDSKIDDGKVASGIFQSGAWSPCSDASSRNNFATANYNLANTTPDVCQATFPNAF